MHKWATGLQFLELLFSCWLLFSLEVNSLPHLLCSESIKVSLSCQLHLINEVSLSLSGMSWCSQLVRHPSLALCLSGYLCDSSDRTVKGHQWTVGKLLSCSWFVNATISRLLLFFRLLINCVENTLIVFSLSNLGKSIFVL